MAVPHYIVNLDLPADQRWTEIIDAYRGRIQAAERLIVEMLGNGWMMYGLEKALASAAHLGLVGYVDELKGIARRADISLSKLILLHLMYEASAHCTSIVMQLEDGTPVHIRTMDWGLDMLKNLTIEVEFRRDGRPLYTTTTWAGSVGVFTGMRHGMFSASINFRIKGDSFLQNFKHVLKGSWPVGFLLRHTLENATSYQQAVSWLSTSSVIAPVYYTLCSVSSEEVGTLITRDRDGEVQRWNFREKGNIVQTNIDHFSEDPKKDILQSIRRREVARRELQKTYRRPEELWAIMNLKPILNDITLYGTLMVPSRNTFETRVKNAIGAL